MKIVVDMQGTQSESRFRGIGRYTRSFVEAIARNRGEHELVLVLSDAFAASADAIRTEFGQLLPQENIRIWSAPAMVREADPRNASRRRSAELLLETFYADLDPDVILITSLFEGFEDDAVTSVKNFYSKASVAVVHYDLIPMVYPEQYLDGREEYKAYYERKADALRKADLLLAISESSRSEVIELLDVPPDAVANISAGVDPVFFPRGDEHGVAPRLTAKYGLKASFILHAGGADERKNLPRLIRAYASLPTALRASHHLVLAGKISDGDLRKLRHCIKEAGLRSENVCFTGYVSNEDLAGLYSLCTLTVLASWHEGFGLTALEAMACGAPVIGAGRSSIPEVLGRADVLFDPFNEASIAARLEEVLSDSELRESLRRYGIERSTQFTWDQCAVRALHALEATIVCGSHGENSQSDTGRLKLAYVSPLPPEKTGIAYYSSDLLRELARLYEVEVILSQTDIADPWIKDSCEVRSVDYFRRNAWQYSRVLYHFGNSHYHEHMFELLDEIPGVVVLHDFYLSDIQAHREWNAIAPNSWSRSLYSSHGYLAVQERHADPKGQDIYSRYPCNLPVLQSALGVITHSETSRDLAHHWYGKQVGQHWDVIPLLRVPAERSERADARAHLGFAETDFLVCSFGLLGPTKQSREILLAFLESPLATDPSAHLVFVGENHSGAYGQELVELIRTNKNARRIQITGWTDPATFRRYLEAADVGVQLRTSSRGETSAAVLDCMNYGLATIVNAHGSMRELDQSAVCLLPEKVTSKQLADALVSLWSDSKRRQRIGERARQVIHVNHAPPRCAKRYKDAIEGFYRHADVGLHGLTVRAAQLGLSRADLLSLAAAAGKNFPPAPRRKQLLLDISALVEHDLKTGIQRVVRALMRELLLHPPAGWTVEPVYATPKSEGYRYARRFTSRFLEFDEHWAEDASAEAWRGDVLVVLDLHHHVSVTQHDFLLGWHRRGVQIWHVVYDLLPVLLPDAFPSESRDMHEKWMTNVAAFDGALCISQAVASEYREWLNKHPGSRQRIKIESFTLGADIENTVPSRGIPANAQTLLAKMRLSPTFLMVGTIEPRKGHAQVVQAMERLWANGEKVNLVIVGKQGWMMDDFIKTLREHPEYGERLIWLEGISDEYLHAVYAASSALLLASRGEGFGLPLIEAAQQGLPIITRDLPVLREVAGDHAYYFSGDDPQALAHCLRDWLTLYEADNHPRPDGIRRATWRDSTAQFIKAVLRDKPAAVTSERDPQTLLLL